MNASISSSQRNFEKKPAVVEAFSGALVPIGGITPLTSIDYPGCLAAVFYTQGCSWRCGYCHNSSLWPMDNPSGIISFDKIQSFLENRKGLLDAVVFSGGEPTLHKNLGGMMEWVKTMGYRIGLHTSGMIPEAFRDVLPFCDWVGMDLKAPFEKYDQITQMASSGAAARASAALLIASGVDHEFRTTFHPDLLSEADLMRIGETLSEMGAHRFVLQAFHAEGCVHEKLRHALLPSPVVSDETLGFLKNCFSSFEMRT